MRKMSFTISLMAIFASIIFFFNGQWPLAKFWKLKKIFSRVVWVDKSGQKIFELNFSFSSITYPLLLSLHNSFSFSLRFFFNRQFPKEKKWKTCQNCFRFLQKNSLLMMIMIIKNFNNDKHFRKLLKYWWSLLLLKKKKKTRKQNT